MLMMMRHIWIISDGEGPQRLNVPFDLLLFHLLRDLLQGHILSMSCSPVDLWRTSTLCLLVPADLDQLNHVPLLNSSGIWTAFVWFVWSWLKVQKLQQIRFGSSDLDNLNSRYYKIIILHKTHLLFKQHRNVIMEVNVSLAWKGFWWQRWGPLIVICSDISLLLPREASKSHFILRYSFMVASRGPAIQLIP